MPGQKIIYIVGFMGSGKTTTGKKLARALGWNFIDLDELIEKNQGKTIKEIFETSGEAAFRELEYDLLRNHGTAGDVIISAGGGAPCYPGNIEFMKESGLVIYLRLSPVELLERLQGGRESRPLLRGLAGNDLLAFIEKKLAERDPYYLQAHITGDGSNPDIAGMAERIREILGD